MELMEESHSKNSPNLDKLLVVAAMALVEIGNSNGIISYKDKTYKILEAKLQSYKYASEKGFSVRKGTIVKMENQLKKRSLFYCKQGFSTSKVSVFIDLTEL